MINVAQIGVGYWGPNLLRNLVSNPRCRVTLVVELSADRRCYVQSLYPGIMTTADSNDVWDDAEIDAVIIATPAATHFDLVMAALKAGKHVLVEKPMAQSSSQVEQIAAMASRMGLVAMVGHTFIYNSAVRYLKKLVDNHELGDIRYIYTQRLNLGRIRSDVDALWNFAPHDVAIIQYLLENPVPISVVRRGMDYIQSGVDDVVFLNITYPEKVMAQIHVSWLDPHKIRKMTIVGTKKMVVYDDIAENKIAIFDKGIEPRAILGENMDFDSQNFIEFSHRSGDVLLPQINYEEPLKTEIIHFLDCICQGDLCLTGTDHAKNVVHILECAR